jgi:hypothetical protein
MACYDTLDDFDLEGAKTLEDVYRAVLGKAMASKELCGVVTTGPLNQGMTSGGNWGKGQLSFRNHPEVWHVRCSPRGRMGMPLRPGEVRVVSVLVRSSRFSAQSAVTNIKLWLRPPDEHLSMAARDPRQQNRGRLTAGPMGLAVHGINIFENRAGPSSKFLATKGSQTILSSIATIRARPGGGGPILRIEAVRAPHFAVARMLAGLSIAGEPMPRRCEEAYTEGEWTNTSAIQALKFRRMCEADPRLAADMDLYLKLMFTSEEICEQMSFIGCLDQRADPFFKGAFPDDMHRPSGIPLMLTIALRVACSPERWGLEASTVDDAFATKDALLFMESILPGLRLGGLTGGGADSEQMYSFDTVISYALDRIRAHVLKLQSGELDGKLRNVDFVKVDRATKETLHFLKCAGTAVCIDLFGVRPNLEYANPGLYAEYGIASQLVDPVTESRAQCAHEKGLGNVMQRWPTLRTSTRGRRQLALASVLVDVDRWLRTGKYMGVILRPTTEASLSARPEELDPAATASNAAPSEALPSTVRSSKKKRRPESLLAERGRMRGAGQQQCATEAARSLLKSTNKSETLAAAASHELNGDALDAASGIFSDVLQQGACAGMTDLYKCTTYLVSPTSGVQCTNCDARVNVVQSVAFAGSLGACDSCGQPRCLACVSKDMNGVSEGLVREKPSATCRICNSYVSW